MFSLNARLFDKRFTWAHARLEISRKARHTEYKPAGPALLRSQSQSGRESKKFVLLCKLLERATLLQTNQPNFIVPVICFRKQSFQEIMALISRDLFRNWWEDMDRYHRELEEHFKRLSTRDDLLQSPPMPSFNEFFRPWKNVMQQLEQQVGGQTTVERDQDKFQVIVDVQQFAPEEITVRTDDKCITVEGKHEEKKDQHGYVSRHFVRRYMLPQGYDIGHVKPSLSSDGVLTITAPKLALPAPGERIVPIERSNGPAIKAA